MSNREIEELKGKLDGAYLATPDAVRWYIDQAYRLGIKKAVESLCDMYIGGGKGAGKTVYQKAVQKRKEEMLLLYEDGD